MCALEATSIWEIMVDIVTALEAVNGNMEKIAGISSLKVFRIIRITRIVKTVPWLSQILFHPTRFSEASFSSLRTRVSPALRHRTGATFN